MINADSTLTLITNAIQDFSVAGLIILGLVITIGVGLLVMYFGWRFLNHTVIGSKIAMMGLPGVSALDRWSFRHSKQYKRMLADSNN